MKEDTQKQENPQIPEKLGEIKLTDDGGVSKTILVPPKDTSIELKDKMEVKVTYVGKLMDGTEFDSNTNKNSPFSFVLGKGSVIKAWDIGVKSMKIGEKCTLFCKPEYAYGEQGSGDKIPANATLQFEIELLSAEFESVTSDGLIRKEVLVEGTGYQTPNDGAECKVRLTGKTQATGKIFVEENEKSLVTDCELEPEGLFIALRKMKKGEKTRFFIQPGDHHFSEGMAPEGVKQDDVLVYEAEMIDFKNKKEIFMLNNKEKLEEAAIAKEKGKKFFKEGKLKKAANRYEYAVSCLDGFRGLSFKTQSIPQNPYGFNMPPMAEDDDDEEGEDQAKNGEKNERKEEKKKGKTLAIACLNNLATVKFKLNDFLAAAENSDKVLKVDENNARALYRKTEAMDNLGDYDTALDSITKAIEVNPKSSLFKKRCAELRRKKLDESKKVGVMYKRMFKGVGRRK